MNALVANSGCIWASQASIASAGSEKRRSVSA
jgi:hypothetical protein